MTCYLRFGLIYNIHYIINYFMIYYEPFNYNGMFLIGLIMMYWVCFSNAYGVD